jgi:hypothetical protein
MTHITPAEHMDFIKRGTYDKVKIKKLIDEGTLDRNILLEHKILTQQQLDEMYYVSPEEHIANIRKGSYTNAQIKELLDKGKLTESDILKGSAMTSDQLSELMGRPVDVMQIDFDWTDVPPLLPDRVDVFVLGIAGSGKSSFMAGLIYYADKMGLLEMGIENTKGFLYGQKLISAVEQRLLPPRTPVESVQYMACDFRNGKPLVNHPLTFIEMSGELFKKLYGVTKESFPPKFHEYLFESLNNKIIFLTVDYKIHEEKVRLDNPQRAHFTFALQFFERNAVLNSTQAICILITKWDASKDKSPAAAQEFLRQEYFSLYRQCERYQEQYGLKFEVFTFSLGEFDARSRYTYASQDSETLFNWLTSFSPVRKEKRKGGWRDGLF